MTSDPVVRLNTALGGAENPPMATPPGRERWFDRAMRGQTINGGRRITRSWKVDRA
jgi:hypothetical protein